MADSKGKELEPSEGGGEEVAPIDDGNGGGKKKLLIILVPLILLIGGGAGAYFTGMLDSLLGKAPATEEAAKEGEHKEAGKEGAHGTAEEECDETAAAAGGGGHEAPKEEKKEEKGAKGGATSSAGPCGISFLKIPDMVVNLNSDTGEQRYLRLSIQLELKNAEDMEKVKQVLPRVVDQFQTYLRELRLSDLRGSKGIYRLQMELLARVNQAAAPVQVKDVLFQEILIQ